jgi:hypothetical protein
MQSEAILREQVTLRVQQGTLPARAPDRTYGGPGVDATCAVCDDSIPKTELELEVEFAQQAGAPGLAIFHVHPKCYAVWSLVIQNGGRS